MKPIFIFLSLCVPFLIKAEIPANYYQTANGKSGQELKEALYQIIKGHQAYSYTQVWDILKVTDRDPNNANRVIGIHSGFSMLASDHSNNDGWNREHVWAKSRGDFGTATGPGTDVHHLRASDISTNGARGNKHFGESATRYIDNAGNYTGTTDCYSSDNTWEPRPEVKGDIARMMFYMATRYEGEGGEPDLELVKDYKTISNDSDPLHGNLDDLLAWHKADPVDQRERDRNDAIYSYQKNRNPFIDHPQYAEYIWGSQSPKPGDATTSINEKKKDVRIYPTPTTDSLYIKASNTILSVSIHTPNGLQLRKILQEGITQINIADLPSGLYILTMTDVSGKVHQQQIIKP